MEMYIESGRNFFGRTAALALVLAIAAMTGGCAELKEKVGELREKIRKMRGLQPAPPPPLPPVVQAAPPAPGAPAAAVEAPAAIPERGLNVRAECSARDETGYTESIKLTVDQGRVGLLEAKFEIPRRGSCGFQLSDFRQTRTAPHVELQSSAGTRCTVRMWEQGGRFTVAFSDCQEKCTRGAFDYVWPVELNSADGSCL
jgi:hypothetical protein